MLFISPQNLFSFSRYLNFYLDFGHVAKRLKDTYRQKAPSTKIQVLTKNMNMDIWVLDALNLVFI